MQHLNAFGTHADENGHSDAEDQQSADERDHSQQPASLRQQVQRDRGAERQEDWKRQQHHARSGCPTSRGGVGSNHVDVVGTGRPMHTVSQYERKCEHSEADDDGREDQGLRNGICELIRWQGRILDERRLGPRHAGGRQDENVGPVRKQTEPDDQLGESSSQHEVQPGRIEHTRENCE